MQAYELGKELSPRQQEIAELVAKGASNKEIARQLGVCNQTVRNTLVHVFRKTAVRRRTHTLEGWKNWAWFASSAKSRPKD